MQGFQNIGSNEAPGLPWGTSTAFPAAVAGLGDLDGNGYPDVLVGDPEANSGTGQVHVLLLGAAGAVNQAVAIGAGVGGFSCVMDSMAGFGFAVAGLGDVNNDGVGDAAVLAPGADIGSGHAGAVFVLLLNSNGSVLACTEHSSSSYATELRAIGAGNDLNGDGTPDLLVGCPNDGANKNGRVIALLLASTGAASSSWNYGPSTTWAGYNPCLNDARFGLAVCGAGDVDGNGFMDIAVSSYAAESSGGAVHVVLLGPNGSVAMNTSISGLEPEDPVPSDPWQRMGFALSPAGDANGDGVPDLAASIPLIGYDGNSTYRHGEVQMLHLLANGGLQSNEAITNEGWLNTQSLGLVEGQPFGASIALLGDYNSDQVLDLVATLPCPTGTSGCDSRIALLMLEPKPIEIAVQTNDETPTQHGSALIKVTGGVAPHSVHWANDLPTQEEFDSLLIALKNADWSSFGLDSNAFTGLSYGGLLALTDYDPTMLKAGTYSVTAIDARKKKNATSFDIGFDLKSDIAEGYHVEGDSIGKTGGDGWYNNEYTSENVLGYKENGWMRFDAPAPGTIMAVGLRAIGVEQLNGYEQMEQAFYFDGSKIHLWYDGELHETSISYTANDFLRLHRLNSDMRFLFNDSLIHEMRVDAELQLFIDIAVYGSAGGVKGLATTFQSTGFPKSLKVKLIVEQMKCGGSQEGHLLAMVPAYVTGATYEWTYPDNSEEQGTASLWVSTPGLYSVTVTWQTVVNGAWVSFQGTASAMVGFEVLWTEHAGTQLGDEPNSLLNASAGMSPANASSANEFNHAGATSADWIERRISGDESICINLLGNNIGFDIVRFQRLSDGTSPAQVIHIDLGPFALCFMPMQGWACLANPGDRIVMTIVNGGLVIDNLDDAIPAGPGFGVTAFVQDAEFRVNGLVPCPGSEIVEALTSFGCNKPQRALLHDDLSAGYHRTYGKALRIGYWEDYNEAQLRYTVKAMDGSVVISDVTHPASITYGYNELDLGMTISGTPIPEGFYCLEVTNSKGVKKYLRFFQDDLQQ